MKNLLGLFVISFFAVLVTTSTVSGVSDSKKHLEQLKSIAFVYENNYPVTAVYIPFTNFEWLHAKDQYLESQPINYFI